VGSTGSEVVWPNPISAERRLAWWRRRRNGRLGSGVLGDSESSLSYTKNKRMFLVAQVPMRKA
jgi:hypothetical protein